jgi:ubiquinol-cytochrome c reductase cytochrome c1 subunit
MFRRLLLSAMLMAPLSFANSVVYAEEGAALLQSGADINNRESLQRGARNFMNYCSGCHSLQYLRYNRMASDLGIADKDLGENLIFNDAKLFDPIVGAMPADAEQWFGKQPPDLSLVARAKGGPDYIYSFLKGFYAEKGRLWGVNNMYLQNAAMPHVLQGLQGDQEPIFENKLDQRGSSQMILTGVKSLGEGAMKPEEYDTFVRDTANFLDYAAEPIKATRQAIGLWVTLFLLVFFAFAYLLKKEYWKDIH